MKGKVKIGLFFILLMLTGSAISAQEVRWSQYYAIMPAINPAATGAFGGDFRLLANYRMSQYSGSAEPFTTMYGSYDQGIKKHLRDGSAKNTFFSYGISFMNDKAGLGSLTSTEIGGLFSFSLKVGERQFLSFGVKASYASRSIDYGNFKWSSQYVQGDGTFDPTLPSDPMVDNKSLNYFPLGAGMIWNYSDPERLKVTVGFAANRLNEPDVAFDANLAEKLPMQLMGNFGLDWYVPNTIISLMPLILFQSQAYYNEINMGFFAKWHLSFDSRMTHIKKTSIFYTGFFYRTTGDMILATKFDLRRNMSLGLTYDMAADGDEVRGRSALEFTLTYAGFFMEKSMIPKKASVEFF